MADSTNNIDITLKDGVDPQIAPKLISIADASDKAEASVGSLKAQLAGLNTSGLGGLAGMLNSVQTSSTRLAASQQTVATAVRATTTSAAQAQTVWQRELFLQDQRIAKEAELARAKELAALRNDILARSENGVAGATAGVVSANISAAAGLGILEGRTLSMNRAAANFMTRILGLGPLLQQAFVVIGAVAMIAVIVQMGKALYEALDMSGKKAREIAADMRHDTDSMRMLNDSLDVQIDKIQIANAKLEHKPVNGMKLAIDEARESADKLEEQLDRDLDRIKTTIVNMAGTTTQQFLGARNGTNYEQGMLADHSRFLSEQNTEQGKSNESVSYGISLNKRLNELIGWRDHPSPTRLVNNLPTEIEAVQHMIKMQEFEQAAITKTMTLEAAQAKHGTDVTNNSLESLAVKQARKDWEALTAAFVAYQTAVEKSGHKPTAQDSLSWLQSQKVNPLNNDKLQAKELPYQNKITGDAQWIQEETDKLANQVNEIGLYSDALKEASMLKNIMQDAQRRSITLTADEIAGYKEQIATIVESKDYQRELATVYDSVNSVQDKFEAHVHALSKEFDAGVLSQDQYNQSITRTIRDYREASDAVVAFQRKLDDAQRDSGNKLGSNRDIVAKSAVQALADSMRKGDATHPGGYSEAEIATQTAAMTNQIRTQQLKNEIDQASNKLLYEQVNLFDELTVHQIALTRAVQAGVMSQQAANAERLKDWNTQNTQQLKSGTGGNPFGGALADYAKQFTTVNQGIRESFSATFKTLADGFADSIGRAITGAKNLGAALKDVARSAIGELISSLIKLAIEYVIVNVLMKKLHIKPLPTVSGPSPKQAAEGVAGMAAITLAGLVMTKLLDAPMWSLAAALAAVTFGASAAAGAAGIASVSAAQTAAEGHANGGYISGPGTGRSDSIVSRLSNGEYVVNASATSQHRDMLDAINSGSSRDQVATQFAPQINVSSNGAPRSQMQVQVHNYNGSRVETQQIDEHTVRLMIHDEVPPLIAKHAPGVIANDMGNPNSKVSKGISNNTFATRRR